VKTGKKQCRNSSGLHKKARLKFFDKLIAKGADVNDAYDSGETALLMSLEHMNVTVTEIIDGKFVSRSLNRQLFNIIQQQPHDIATVNLRTQKKRLLPIISTIETGRIDVVKRILEMGATPNHRGKTDEQHPLIVCLKMIAHHKASLPVLTPISTELLDSMRRQSGGLNRHTLDDQRRALAQPRPLAIHETS